MAKKTVYVVVRGRNPGIYSTWSGEEGAAKEVQGFSGALYRGFARREDALAWIESLNEERLPRDVRTELKSALGGASEREAALPADGCDRQVVIYTDGGAIDNPGPGGYGVVLRFGEHQKELSGGYRMTTNNRMELMACIAALEALKRRCSAVLYSDSRYVVDGITKGWAERWRRHHWQRANGEPAENADLWSRLLTLHEQHDVTFRWVKGHAGRPGNERADQLASEAARRDDLPPDVAFETGETNPVTPHLL
jgi:ribonuclease HI